MWFRNLMMYQITQEIDWNLTNIEELLEKKIAKPCAKHSKSSLGFVSPLNFFLKKPISQNQQLLYSIKNFSLITISKEEKILPNSVINDELIDKINTIEKKESRKIYKKERLDLKDEIISYLLPKAFIKKNFTSLFICHDSRLIFIDTASLSKADEILSFMRETFGSFPVKPITPKEDLTLIFKKLILNQNYFTDFQVLDECEIHGIDTDDSTIKCKKIDFKNEEILSYIKSGKKINQISLEWNEQIKFMIDHNLILRRIKFSEVEIEKAEEDSNDDKILHFDASFVIMTSILSQLAESLINLSTKK